MHYLSNVVTLALDPARCTGCGMCAAVCPRAVFDVVAGRAQLRDRDACIECGACMRNCPAAAVRVRAGVGCAAALLSDSKTCGCDGDSPSCCG